VRHDFARSAAARLVTGAAAAIRPSRAAVSTHAVSAQVSMQSARAVTATPEDGMNIT
jgi:hypothetical protein